MVRLVLILILALSAPLAAGAKDGARVGLTAAAQEQWLAVGRLNVTGQGFCTATLVAPDLVLTAAHCLVDKRTGRVVTPDRVHFLAGYRTGQYAGHGRGAALALMDGFSRTQQTLSRDIGLVRLTEPMSGRIRPLKLAEGVEDGASLDVLSYAIDRSQLPSLQGACNVTRRSGAVLFTSCEGVPGVSGAPLLVAGAEGPELVGVASSVSTRVKLPIVRGNLIAIAADPGMTGPLLVRLGLAPSMLAGGL